MTLDFDKIREQKLIALAEKGSCTTQELLEADFGEWPPKGLDIVNPPTGTIEFKPAILTTLTTPRSWPGLIDIGTIAQLYIWNRSLPKAIAIGIASHLLSVMGFVDDSLKERRIHINEFLSLWGHINKSSESFANTVSHEHTHLLQVDDKNTSLTSSLDDRLAVGDELRFFAGSHAHYVAGEAELQARLHTIIANCYQQTGQMPLNPAELLAALKCQGVEIPQEAISAVSERRLPANTPFVINEKFLEENSDKEAAKDINRLTENLKEEFQMEFWTSCMPQLYGDLLELYGDSKGSERMGFSHNIQLREIFYKQVLNLKEDPARAEQHLRRATEVVGMMPRNQAAELKRLVIAQTPYDYGDDKKGPVTIPPQYADDLVGLFGHAVRSSRSSNKGAIAIMRTHLPPRRRSDDENHLLLNVA